MSAHAGSRPTATPRINPRTGVYMADWTESMQERLRVKDLQDMQSTWKTRKALYGPSGIKPKAADREAKEER